MEKLIRILESIKKGIDYKNEQHLISGKKLDSFDIMAIVTTLCEEYDISIVPMDIVPENFESAEAMLALVKRLEEV